MRLTIRVSSLHCLRFNPQLRQAVVVIQGFYVTDGLAFYCDGLDLGRAAKDRQHRLCQCVSTLARGQFRFLRPVHNLQSYRRSELSHVDAPSQLAPSPVSVTLVDTSSITGAHYFERASHVPAPIVPVGGIES